MPRVRRTAADVIFAALCCALPAPAQDVAPPAAPAAVATDDGPLEEMSLEELMNTNIVSASNAAERLKDAPATVIVLTRDEILDRGYTDLSQILDDLPGMDVVRPRGDTYLKNYWRGYRNTIGDPFLIMVDGVVFNHLYFNTADVMATFPLSNVQRIEVVYGPASAVYGPNAFMGVINVITSTAEAPEGASHWVSLTAGSARARIVDATAAWRRDDLRVSITARFENGELDDSATEDYEYTRNAYYGDRRLWGGFVDNPAIAGGFASDRRQRAVSARAALGGAEVGFDWFSLDSGYGVVYAADKVQNDAVWERPDLSAFLRLRRPLGKLVSSTLVRWRRSGVDRDSTFLESNPGTGSDGAPALLVDFSFWHSRNTSLSAFQDFELDATSTLSLTAGFKYEEKDLQKAYDTNYGPSLPAATVDASRYPYPPPPFGSAQAQNRITTEDKGAYALARWAVRESQHLNVGVRRDHNSQYGGATTLRAGYVGHFGKWGAKALVGEAFQEPTPRLLYGGWTGSGSDPDLLPERSRTVELSATHTGQKLRNLLSVYFVENHDTIVNTAGGAQNLGDRSVIGLDWHLDARLRLRERQVKLWGYYSRIVKADEQVGGASQIIGDLAYDKAWLGVSADVAGPFRATVLARWVGARETVPSNPIRRIDGFTTVDVSVVGDDLFGRDGLGVWLRVTNLFDTHHFHPGIRDASAGDEPGAFDATGRWQGSRGFFNSLLPQPGRAVLLSLRLQL